jgi:hypothetical protein
MKRSSDELRWGNAAYHFGCVVHMLESMKEFDPDTRILLKLFPDSVNPFFFNNPTEYKRNLKGKSTVPQPDEIFALRFGAISLTMGTAVCRLAAASLGELLMRNL